MDQIGEFTVTILKHQKAIPLAERPRAARSEYRAYFPSSNSSFEGGVLSPFSPTSAASASSTTSWNSRNSADSGIGGGGVGGGGGGGGGARSSSKNSVASAFDDGNRNGSHFQLRELIEASYGGDCLLLREPSPGALAASFDGDVRALDQVTHTCLSSSSFPLIPSELML